MDRHTVDSVEWHLNGGSMGMDVPIERGEDISGIVETTIDWEVWIAPDPKLVADNLLVATKSKIPSEPHSFIVNENQDVDKGRVGLKALCFYPLESESNVG